MRGHMNQRIDIDGIKERIKEYLPQYLTEQGHQPPQNYRYFRCINPDHNDTSPSCHVMPNTDDKLFHCFSCNVTGDIFMAASFLEDKPLSGRGFVSDNLLYLAQKYSIEVPDLNLTEDEIYEMDVYQAYANAAAVIKAPGKMSDRVKAWLTDRGWLDTENSALRKIGVGSVDSYEDYIKRMTVNYKHRLEFLEEIDLTRKYLFHQDNVLFTIKDENGAPVGFAARNLRYEDQKVEYDAKRQEILSQPAPDPASLDGLFKPTKYINTSEKCPIYQKSKRLFNFNIAK